MNKLISSIVNDIHAFLNPQNRLFFNEAEFQHGLAKYLEDTGKYNAVYLEYKLPNDLMSETNPKAYFLTADIVVKLGDDYVPIELKYKFNPTVKLHTGHYRFGKGNEPIILTDQNFRNDYRKECWHDVERLERLNKRYPNVCGGIFVLLTNDDDYEKNPGTKYNGALSLMPATGAQPVIDDVIHINIQHPHAVDWYPTDPNTYCMGQDNSGFRYCIIIE